MLKLEAHSDLPISVRRPAQRLSESFMFRAASLRLSPGFKPAIARYCHRMAEKPPVVWPIYKLFGQFERYVAAYLLIHNYYAWREGQGPSPTLAALQKVTPSSARQTAGFVAALKAGRFLESAVKPAGGREKPLKPTAVMVEEIGRSGRLFVSALDEIETWRPAWALALMDIDRLGVLLQRSAAFVLGDGTLIHPFQRVLHFAGRDCGYPLLTAIIGAHYAATIKACPQAVPLTLRALAARFQVSRAHIGNLLDEARQANWFIIEAGNLVHLDNDLVLEFENWACWQMVHYGEIAATLE
ncbi:hypothetical protein [Labrys sp. 22185]|uniref:hypothetical protein n=1 Tax=Labrys sp. 22185 TaxID=3453888 RepID=UPI003F852834